MKDRNHYVHKLIDLMVRAEQTVTRTEAQRILRKNKKHNKKLRRLAGTIRISRRSELSA